MSKAIRLIGIGQPLRGDDALGLEAVEAWQRQHQVEGSGIEVLALESPGLNLLEAISGCTAAIIVDAIRSGGRAGEIYVLSEADLASFGPAAASAHGLGVAETLAFARALYPEKLPATIVLIGIEAGTIQVGDPISPAGRRALPLLVDQIQQTIQALPLPSTPEEAALSTEAGD